MTSILWFRQDLRLSDNPALVYATAQGPIIPVYIFDDTQSPALGGASQWWLHHSLKSLRDTLKGLIVLRGDPVHLIPELTQSTGASAVFWNRCYDPHAIKRDKALKSLLLERGLIARSFNASLIHEPWQIETQTGGPYKVFSAFWRAASQRQANVPLARPLIDVVTPDPQQGTIDDLSLLPHNPDWAATWLDYWSPGEAGALERLNIFLAGGIEGYGELRNRPDLGNVSRLSPHLRFGEVSPREIFSNLQRLEHQRPELSRDIEKFKSELGWREFSHHLLFHFPDLQKQNWRAGFDAYPWRNDPESLVAWQKGQTGYPFVDAGLRELWQTGYVHNRVRMVVASFLTKHLRIHWRTGESWFWDTLLDADTANNAAGWQWVAGCGADAAPYFRIFNPIEQGRKFDPNGAYVRKWCPELSALDSDLIHAPFEAPPLALETAGVRLGKNYPHPIVSHKAAREAALKGYETVKRATHQG